MKLTRTRQKDDSVRQPAQSLGPIPRDTTAEGLRAALRKEMEFPVEGTSFRIRCRCVDFRTLIARGVVTIDHWSREDHASGISPALIDTFDRIICAAAISPRVVYDEKDANDDAVWVGDLPWATRITIATAVTKANGRPDAKEGTLAPYVPTPRVVVAKMLELATVTAADVVYDLGCGDGRIVIQAARRYGARGVGIDFEPDRIAEACGNAKRAGVAHLVEFRQQEILTIEDLAQATVVTLYLLGDSNVRVRDVLFDQLQPGARVVSHAFTMGGWEENARDIVRDDKDRSYTLYRWDIEPHSEFSRSQALAPAPAAAARHLTKRAIG